MRIRGISRDADKHLALLQAELRKLELEKEKRPVNELRQALNMVLDIAERGQLLFKAAARASEVLTRDLGRQIAEDIRNAPELAPAPLWPDPRAVEDEAMGGVEPPPPAAAVPEDEAVSDVGPPPPAAAVSEDEAMSDVGLPPHAATVSEDCAAEADTEVDEPPYTPLTAYTIPETLFDFKLSLPDDDPGKFWNHSFYTNSEGKGVKVHYCKTIEDSERVLQEFMHERVVGFDMEWIFPQRSKTSIRYTVPNNRMLGGVD